ncbi:WD40-repeat-containing domain protein [Chytriomyces sp. MP71]|nr:WD40-repeat-containing domain protein [Chytriomyces sp. MP71]
MARGKRTSALHHGASPRAARFDPWTLKRATASEAATTATDRRTRALAVNSEAPVLLGTDSVETEGAVNALLLSPCASLLLALSSEGTVQVFDIRNGLALVATLWDEHDSNARDDFHVGCFPCLDPDPAPVLPDVTCLAARTLARDTSKTVDKNIHSHQRCPITLAVAGKRIDSSTTSDDLDDIDSILPCDIKIFDLTSGVVTSRLKGHSKDVLALVSLRYKGSPYYLSAGQDGSIFKWTMATDWVKKTSRVRMQDPSNTIMAFSISLLSHTGNRYFLASCDNRISVFDFEQEQMLQTFASDFSCYCDFITSLPDPFHLPQSPSSWSDLLEATHIDIMDDNDSQPESGSTPIFSYLLSRGVEWLNANKANAVHLFKLTYPRNVGGLFKLDKIQSYSHPCYEANSWPTRLTATATTLFAPTNLGDVVIFDLPSGAVGAVLRDHEPETEVRDVLVHPDLPVIFTCGDDGGIKVYRSS